MATSADWWDYGSGELAEKIPDTIWTVTAARQVNNWRIKNKRAKENLSLQALLNEQHYEIKQSQAIPLGFFTLQHWPIGFRPTG
jgi:hypothetical protein